MNSPTAIVLFCIGMIFNLLGCVGLIRFPDLYNRLQAATKCVTLGTCMVLLSAVVELGFGDSAATSVKCLLCMAFILITSPTAAHALARGAHASGVTLWEKSVVDRFEEDGDPGVVRKEE
jgi:multicomponent Na+:H+ antiporter subunit G